MDEAANERVRVLKDLIPADWNRGPIEFAQWDAGTRTWFLYFAFIVAIPSILVTVTMWRKEGPAPK